MKRLFLILALLCASAHGASHTSGASHRHAVEHAAASAASTSTAASVEHHAVVAVHGTLLALQYTTKAASFATAFYTDYLRTKFKSLANSLKVRR